MKRGYMDWNKELLPQSALDQRRQALRDEAKKADVKAVIVYGDVYSADELSYYVNYAPYWCNSASVITEDDVYNLSDVVLGKWQGRTDDSQIVNCSSLGLGALDIMIGYKVFLKAKEMGIGTEIKLWDKPLWE